MRLVEASGGVDDPEVLRDTLCAKVPLVVDETLVSAASVIVARSFVSLS
jgi:hypothetical protein